MKYLTLFFLFNVQVVLAQTTYYVSNNGYDYPVLLGDGTYSKPYKTLKRAYDRIVANGNAGSVTYNIVIKSDGGEVLIAPSLSGFVWGSSASGSLAHPINILAEGCQSTVTRANDNMQYMIKFLNVSYINISRIKFKNISKGALMLDNADYCKIEYCHFVGVNYVNPTQHAVIWIGVQDGNSSSKSYGNKIYNNLIEDIFVNNDTVKSKFQAIYLATKSEYNEIANNTIFDPPSFAIHFWHQYYNNNQASYNILTMNVGQGCNSNACALGGESGEDGTTVTYNYITSNYVHDDYLSNVPVYLGSEVEVNNDPSSAGEQYLNYLYNILYPSDPYWLGYNPNQITNSVVTGDFDRDGSNDDIAAFYDNGDGTVNIHVWNTSGSENAFKYSGGTGWWAGTYNLSKVSDRIVAGDFDRDGYEDDIAAVYDVGVNQTRIDVWTSTGSAFNNPSTWWSVGSSYNASKVNGRVLSGDFDKDGKNDDIAAFYDNGGTSTTIHTWLSNGSSFLYSGSSGWWNVSSGYDCNKITDRVVRGDFNRDGFDGDIAAFYDNGGSSTTIHVWITSGTNFSYSGGSGWWNVASGYIASKTTGKVIAGDFDNDNKYDDLAAFYDNGSSSTNLHVWTSTGTSLNYSGGTGWWSSTGYDVTKITGRVVSADFDRDGYQDDITSFYDYTNNCGSLRTNVWQSTGSYFGYANNSLGYPWLTTFPYRSSNFVNAQTNFDSTMVSSGKTINVFPNPTKEIVNINYSVLENGNVELEIYNSSGHLIKKLNLGNHIKGDYNYQFNLNDNSFPSSDGFYFCVYKNENHVERFKLVVIK